MVLVNTHQLIGERTILFHILGSLSNVNLWFK